ncbi:hypothetical protein [Spirillospora sp. NBC_01491]|uniref:hypothetical protein n=1 Tax=Spirillospora sp. NBC_01491 TaxID=2976007 RepID=UPI002E346F1E|nr:hypothetical protein [Spirillospora sp. NBC_01491]
MTAAGYFDELAARLRDCGVPAAEVAGTVDDLAAYLAESGTAPEDEFGPVADFAAELAAAPDTAPDGTPGAPDPDAETWDFHADAFNEVGKLNEFGGQGWEVLSYDAKAGFACRRSLDRPQRWEYRREIVPPPRRRAAAERLADDGWEVAAAWTIWLYFKRPAAATVGPAAEIDAPPDAPRRRMYWSRGLAVYLVLVIAGVEALVFGLSVLTTGETPGHGAVRGFLMGFPVGSLLGLALLAVGITRHRRKAVRRG